MNYTKKEVKKGIAVHNIVTDKFKTNLYAVFLAIPLSKEDVTKNALITAVLRRGTENIKTQEEISKKLEEMYGASFDCGVEKTKQKLRKVKINGKSKNSKNNKSKT